MEFSPKVNFEAFLCLNLENEENWRIGGEFTLFHSFSLFG